MNTRKQRMTWVLPLGLILLATSFAAADISDVVFRVEATNDSGSGSVEFTSDVLTYLPGLDAYTWTLPFATEIWDDDTPFLQIATLQSGNLLISADPKIALGFSVISGDSDTAFTITSPLLGFTTIPDAYSEGQASAAVNVTDQTGDGAALTEIGDTSIYHAQYNGLVPGGTPFVSLLSGVSAGPGGSDSVSDDYPLEGFADVAGDVDDMSAQLNFMLTAGDLGGGTTFYEIAPEPATFGVAVLGVLMLVRRRR